VSTGQSAIENFTDEIGEVVSQGWTPIRSVISLDEYAGNTIYLAIVHHGSAGNGDGSYRRVDDILLPLSAPEYSVSWTEPMEDESFDIGETVTIQWNSDFPEFYGSIDLYEYGTYAQTLDSNFYFWGGSQSFTWEIPATVLDDSAYQIVLNTQSYSYWSPIFAVKNATWTIPDNITVIFSEDFSDSTLSPFQAEGNWQIDNNFGYLKPAAVFMWSPQANDYSHSLTLPSIDGLAVADSVILKYDLYFSGYTQETLEEFAVEISTGDSWDTLATYNNNSGDIPWGSHVHLVSDYFPTDSVQIRFRAYGVNSYNLNWWYVDNVVLGGVPDDTPPANPQNLSATTGDQQITLTWTPNSDDDLISYNIYRGSYSPPDSLFAMVTATANQEISYVDYAVTNDELYYYHITAVDQSGNESGNSNEISAEPYDLNIGAIELLSDAEETGTSGSEQGYPLNTWFHDVKHQSLYFSSDLADAGILSGSQITAIRLKISELPGMPNFPPNVQTAHLKDLRIAVAWTDSVILSDFDTTTQIVHGPMDYADTNFQVNSWKEFEFDTPFIWDGVSNLIVEYSHDNDAYNDPGAGGIYMRSVNSERGRRGWTDSDAGDYPFYGIAAGPESKVAAISLVVEDADIVAPSNLMASGSYQKVDVSWTASTSFNIAWYLIYRGTSTEEMVQIDSVASTVTSYSDSSLNNGVTYYYGIKTKVADGGLSALTTPVSAMPSLETPETLMASSGVQQVTLTWDNPTGSGVAHTLIYRGLSSNTSLSLEDSTSTANTATKIITGLTNGTTYDFAIRYRGVDNSVGAYSDTVSVTPNYIGPDWYVSTSGSDDTGDGSSSAPFATISAAYTAAAAGDTINLQSGTFSGAGNRNITLSKNLVITSVNGPDYTTLDAGGAGSHFHFATPGDTLTHVIGLTLKNSSESSFLISGSSPRITNCVFKDNVSTGNGGAVNINGDAEVFNDFEYAGSFDGSDYYFSNDVVTWQEAKDISNAAGGHLVTISSVDENDFIYSLTNGEISPWIGLTDEEVEDNWTWVTGEEATYTNWAEGEPSDSDGEDYVHMWNFDGTWNDANNETENEFIIEFATPVDKADPVFTNCTFRDNTAKEHGGAIYMGGGSADSQSTPLFVSCTIASNDVISVSDDFLSGYGGGFSSTDNMRPEFVDCHIDSNTVVAGRYSGFGGGGNINAVSGGAVTTFTRCTFRGNTVTPNQDAFGGGLYAEGEIELTNCLISENSSVGGGSDFEGKGGGIYSLLYEDYSSESKIINSTIVDNNASSAGGSSAGGAYFEGNNNVTITMFNNIVWGNTADEYTSIYKVDDVILDADYNDIEDYDYSLGSNSFGYDPLFTAAATGDFSLSDASPLIGAGTSSYGGNSAPANDIISATRPNPGQSNPDMGAYENSLSNSPYPSPVSGARVTAGNQSAVLVWTANSDGDIVSYNIYEGTTSNFTPSISNLVTTVTHPVVTITITGLTNGTTYYYQISAVDEDSYEGSYSSVISVVPGYTGPAWYVSSSGNNATGDGSSSAPFATIQYAISRAADNDTISLKPGTFSGYGNYDINPEKDLVIMGIGGADSVTIDVDASFENRHYGFHLDEYNYASLKLKGMTIVNAISSDSYGGAIKINSA